MTRTVLIVDDHDTFRACARELIEAEGFHVVGEAEDGASGVAAARALKPDIVVLDVQLPDFDGFRVIEELHANGARPKVVLVSTRDRSDYGDLVDRSGAAVFVCKDDLEGRTLSELIA